MDSKDPLKAALDHLDLSFNMIRAFGHGANNAETPEEILQFLNWVFEYLLGVEELNGMQIDSLAEEVERIHVRLDGIEAALRAKPRKTREAVMKSHARRRAALKADRPVTVKGAPGKMRWPRARAVAPVPDSDRRPPKGK